jgi:nitrite reductase (NO-forming)
MRSKFQEVPFLMGVLILAVMASTIILVTAHPREQVRAASVERAPLVLVPKAQLQTEPAEWAFAPNVPAPITRKEQRRVVVSWSVKETSAEIAPGVIYDDFWAFEGKVPGPILRVREGDLVEVHLTNDISSKRPHNIDFHFVMGPGGGAAALTVDPGKSAVLEARAMAPGFYMFHCATPDIPTHISNGMYGFVLVEPAEGLPAVDKEIYMVQSEYYTKPAKPLKKGHVQFAIERGDKMDPEYVVFNGAVGSMMKDKTVQLDINKRVRIFMGNAGPNLISSFHVIGQIFDNVYREGDLISSPAHNVQTTLVPAGGAAVVEFMPIVPGPFLAVDHAIFRLHKGAAAAFKVNGAANPEVFEPKTPGMQEMSADSHLGSMGDMHHDHAAMAMPAARVEEKPVTTAPTQKSVVVYPNGIPSAVPAPVPAEEPLVASLSPSVPSSGGKLISAKQFTVRILNGSGNYDKNPNNDFSPRVITVKAGTTVVWRNDDKIMPHAIHGDKNEFASVFMQPSDDWSMKFDKPGVYQYSCTPHPWMKGTVIVK